MNRVRDPPHRTVSDAERSPASCSFECRGVASHRDTRDVVERFQLDVKRVNEIFADLSPIATWLKRDEHCATVCRHHGV